MAEEGADEVTPERYAACGQVVASRRGNANGPVDQALAALGLRRSILAVVPDFSAALAIAKASDLIALVTASFHDATNESQPEAGRRRSRAFPLPVQTEPITVSRYGACASTPTRLIAGSAERCWRSAETWTPSNQRLREG